MRTGEELFSWDYLDLFVKDNNFSEVVETYSKLGWVYIEHNQDALYENIQVVQFKRPHNIRNKDELQFLQVGVDNTLMKKGHLEKNKHSFSTIFGIIFGLLSAFFLLLPILNYFYKSVSDAWGIASGGLGLMLAGFTIWLTLKQIKKENAYYEKTQAELANKLASYLEKASSLVGGAND